MNISAACPTCGAALDLSEQPARVDCPFCGSHFEVDFSSAVPVFQKSTAPEVFVPRDDDIISPPAPPAENGDTSVPSQSDVFSGAPGQPYNLPPLVQQAAARFGGPRLWIALAVATLVIFCLSCGCLLLVVRFAFNS